jgi:phosphatidate cytidylyltransferase
MLARILTAAVLIPIVVALVWWGPLALLAAIAAAVAIVALYEFFNLAERVGQGAFRKWTAFCAIALFYAQYSASFVETHTFSGGVSLSRDLSGYSISIEMVLLLFLFGLIVLALATRLALSQILPALGASSAAMLLVALPFSYLVRIAEIDTIGRLLLLLTLCLIWAGDMLAYFVGRSMGRFKMAPVLSPKKTWEGAFANVVGSLLVAAVFARWLQVDTVSLLLIAGFANVVGQMGDLSESVYKRAAAVKDSSDLLPGHGGMLDRIDSLILASPVVWVCYLALVAR